MCQAWDNLFKFAPSAAIVSATGFKKLITQTFYQCCLVVLEVMLSIQNLIQVFQRNGQQQKEDYSYPQGITSSKLKN